MAKAKNSSFIPPEILTAEALARASWRGAYVQSVPQEPTDAKLLADPSFSNVWSRYRQAVAEMQREYLRIHVCECQRLHIPPATDYEQPHWWINDHANRVSS